ncbi:MAG: hypothetical protein IJU96_08605 [Clostridia bacterium]|nr:hypothetical protein [Clostridia bacterium]
MTENKRITILAAVLAAVMLCACLLPALIPFAQKIIDNSSENFGGSTAGSPRAVALREGDYVRFGVYRGEPLLWQVIQFDQNGRPLLIADEVICFKAFDVPTDAAVYGSSDWDDCSLKRWLNSAESLVEDYGEKGFLSADHFTAAERESIAESGVFLPAKNDLKNAQSLSLKKRCQTGAADSTDFLILPKQSVWYWTQTPNGSSRASVVCVTSSGGFYKTLASDKNTGVCPALFLRSSAVTAVGDGTKTAPYLFAEGGEQR